MIDAAVESIGLPEGVIDEDVVGTGVGGISTVEVLEVSAVGVDTEGSGFDANLGIMANNAIMITTSTAAVIPIIRPVGLFRGEIVGGIGNGGT
jgi:hypothetical protein